MSDQTPLLSEREIATGGDMDRPRALTAYQVRAIYEADRQALLSVVQELVDALPEPDDTRLPIYTRQRIAQALSKIKSTLNIEPKP